MTDTVAVGTTGRRAGRAAPVGGAAAIGALGIVFGDIGTSGLYTYQQVVTTPDSRLDKVMVLGTVSMLIWSLFLVVTVLYVRLLMRTDNAGEGGLLALFGLLRLSGGGPRITQVCAVLAMIGAATFLGDSVITPAVSVLSAVEGIETFDTDLAGVVVPIAVVILTGLFLLQRFGTERIGGLFGPVMVVWFSIILVVGLLSLVRSPEVLAALSPHWIALLVAEQPWVAFVALGGVVLAITGAEALYADMGHFGRRPIALAWLAVVFPALVCNYLGQGAEVLRNPDAVNDPFWGLIPHWATIPTVVIATLATVIASQAVISGSFSVVHQAGRLGLLPRLRVTHTSDENSRQIYLPAVNLLLAAGVLTLVLTFRSSEALTDAYGLAVTMTIVITTTIYLVLRHVTRQWSWEFAVGAFIWVIMLFFLASNALKIPTGGWLPLSIGFVVASLMGIWSWGTHRLRRRLQDDAGTADYSIDTEIAQHIGAARVPGTAVYLGRAADIAPLAMRSMLDFTHALHEHVLIVHSTVADLAVVPAQERIRVVDHGSGVYEIAFHIGYYERFSVPELVRLACDEAPELARVDVAAAIYFLSDVTPHYRARTVVATWRQRVFIGLDRLAPERIDSLGLPNGRTVVVGRDVDI
ncbi:KUP/HAK/KT family potassium transporter [Nakamurella flavida]|uniref:Probable potassium transport system protein Kup n=1 Tax=Nakamurella flavida TaxID=363630 RepID=A0A938YLN4_9ACTN|nr:KUP/HAK/KT family potassium transporter [Nakamurella flavida]MBM9475313.1 KUP/HAK/KT family potassium transporter [Nakamurella flavida]MDP9776887.1 KUP system potassium uptake protein [Nakamurella flavida]